MAHRESISGHLRTLTLEDLRVIDWGAGTKPVKNYVAAKGSTTFFGIDKLGHVGADLVTDISQPVNLEREFDMAFCMEVLEHVERPENLVQNIARHLKSGGELHLSVPFLYPRHHDTEDFWRFTDLGVKLLLERNGFIIHSIVPTEQDMGWLVVARKQAV